MRIPNCFDTIGHTNHRDEAGNEKSSVDTRFDGRYARETRNSLPLRILIQNDLSMKNNKYRKKRGVRIAPNISKQFEER